MKAAPAGIGNERATAPRSVLAWRSAEGARAWSGILAGDALSAEEFQAANQAESEACRHLPSIYLWDANAAKLSYAATGEYVGATAAMATPCDIADFTGAASDVLIRLLALEQTPQALLVPYPFANRFHFAIRPPTPETKALVSNQTGIKPEEVAMGLFCGAVGERIVGQYAINPNVWGQLIKDLEKTWSDAASQNYAAVVKDGMDVVGREQSKSGADKMHDQYVGEVTSRSFFLHDNGAEILVACLHAHANGTSIADAIDAVKIKYGKDRRLATLHRENEQNALAAVNAPEFEDFAHANLMKPEKLRATWLADAGCAASGIASPFLALSFSDQRIALPAKDRAATWKTAAKVAGVLTGFGLLLAALSKTRIGR